jgi:hypothetical protein
MRIYFLTAIAILSFFLGGCSTKEYYEPSAVQGDWPTGETMEESIASTAFGGAVLENGQIVTPDGIEKRRVPPSYTFVGNSGGWIISKKIDGTLLLQSDEGRDVNETFALKSTVATAAVQGDTLAVLFASNEMALYSLGTKALLFKEQGNAPVAVDNRIAPPYFLNELVLFSTLDGKIVIVNSESKQVLRSMIVSSEEYFNNIIYFKVIGNNMVAATGYRLFALSEKERREPYELRDVVYTDEGIWISTKQGEVIALTPALQLKAKQKFPFAHFLGMIVHGDRLYLLEKEGYLIVMSKDLSTVDVYEVDIGDGYVFVGNKAFYVDDDVIAVE